MPSILMLSTPARSDTISPIPASKSGVASRIEDGRFDPADVTQTAAVALLDELVRVEAALRPLRAAHTA